MKPYKEDMKIYDDEELTSSTPFPVEISTPIAATNPSIAARPIQVSTLLRFPPSVARSHRIPRACALRASLRDARVHCHAAATFWIIQNFHILRNRKTQIYKWEGRSPNVWVPSIWEEALDARQAAPCCTLPTATTPLWLQLTFLSDTGPE
jgi:hypothetical protein